MKEGKLKEYIDSITGDIKQMILSDNYSLDYYISSIESMINAKTSLQDRRFANLLSYNISVKTFVSPRRRKRRNPCQNPRLRLAGGKGSSAQSGHF